MMIDSYIKRLNNTFSPSMLIFHVIVLLSMCMEMYRASTQLDLLACLRPMLYSAFGLFQFFICYCAYSQALINEANDVSINIYLSEWHESPKYAKSIMMMIGMAQREIKITAGGIANIDFKTGLDVFSKDEELVYQSYRPPWLPYPILLFQQIIVGSLCTLGAMLPVDFLFMSIVTLTTVQYKILNVELRQLFDIEDTAQRKQLLKKKIGEYVRHHAYLYDYVKRINNTFSPSLLVFLVIVLLSMCMEMYRTSTQSNLSVCIRPLLYTSFGLFQFFICYCAYSQALINEANNVYMNIYLSEWQESIRPAKSAIMIIAMAQKEIEITAGGIANIDLKTGLATLKTMISYCMFLRTIAQIDNT
ncbi:unnamed protein product [Acanthoscelides obtectus]|uniref:Odorant receptor n=1 Tax=Acanthoscelides obtectus TaxID=200917 RepID=A0A9P0PW59_ACAOB|nr:unnamed protein product [Acanthoscelides obtectus]CAK1669467.1 Odorant receptor 13a [Acanthoscelides obtectus]